jgi:ATP-dependent Clp protease adaptor protein ClpS
MSAPSSSSSSFALPLVRPAIDADETARMEPRYRVLIHNDSVTTFEYVIRVLVAVFLLSDEIAEHIAETAHNNGTAVVVVRPKSKADKLAKVAMGRARMDGYPLTFSIEQDD